MMNRDGGAMSVSVTLKNSYFHEGGKGEVG